MRIYAPTEVIAIMCPKCGSKTGFWCAPFMVCETRLRAWEAMR